MKSGSWNTLSKTLVSIQVRLHDFVKSPLMKQSTLEKVHIFSYMKLHGWFTIVEMNPYCTTDVGLHQVGDFFWECIDPPEDYTKTTSIAQPVIMSYYTQRVGVLYGHMANYK